MNPSCSQGVVVVKPDENFLPAHGRRFGKNSRIGGGNGYASAMKKQSIALALACLGICTSAHAGRDTPFDFGPGFLTFYLDNDLFSNRDQDYTNGARLSWISSNRKMKDIGAVQRALRPLTGDDTSPDFFQNITGFDDPENVAYNYGFSLTQLMYTPEDFTSETQPLNERRYAGWAALGFSLHAKDSKRLNTVEFLLGITGKYSFAEDAQDLIHDFRDIPRFQGWDDQIPTEVTADLSFLQRRRLPLGKFNDVISMDGFTEWGMRLGTFRTSAQLGGMIRWGFYLPADFSDPRLSETAYTHKFYTEDDNEQKPWSLYLLTGFRGFAIAHDTTLDGSLFRSFNTGVNREPFVGEVYAGIGWRIHAVEISYAHTWRTEEYREQEDESNFGTVSVRLQF
jgi:lipid A 3-O-deacylase